ncbi:MAG: hypothetical protein AAB652_01965 [Patescibacteria group bacterium]
MFDSYKDIGSFKESSGYIIDGVWYPRVTKIISIKAKPALLRFYGEAVNFRAAQNVTEKSAAEGTLVHEAAEAILLGKDPEVDLSIKPSIDAFRIFFEERNIQSAPEWVERRIFHTDHRYAGTIDALALIDGKFGVLDIKTSQGIYRDYNLQTAAYMEALKGDFRHLQTRWILRIDQIQRCMNCSTTLRTKGGREKIKNGFGGGLCSVREHSWGETVGVVELQEFPYWQNDFEAFLGAKKLWEWENDYWLKKVGYL